MDVFVPAYATRTMTTNGEEHAYYNPPINGIHLCGQGIDDSAATAAAYPMSADRAQQLFATARDVAECAEDEGDFIADLFIGGDIVDDFWTNRQLWPLALTAWLRKLEGDLT